MPNAKLWLFDSAYGYATAQWSVPIPPPREQRVLFFLDKLHRGQRRHTSFGRWRSSPRPAEAQRSSLDAYGSRASGRSEKLGAERPPARRAQKLIVPEACRATDWTIAVAQGGEAPNDGSQRGDDTLAQLWTSDAARRAGEGLPGAPSVDGRPTATAGARNPSIKNWRRRARS